MHDAIRTLMSQRVIKEKIEDVIKKMELTLNKYISSKNTRFYAIKLLEENGVASYEIDFKVGNKEYSYDINAKTGNIIDKEVEIDD